MPPWAHTLSLLQPSSPSPLSLSLPCILRLTWLSSSSGESQWRWRHPSCRRWRPGVPGSWRASTRSRRTTRRQPWSHSHQGRRRRLCAMRAAAAWRSSSTPLCTAPTSWPSSPPWRRPSASRSKPKFGRRERWGWGNHGAGESCSLVLVLSIRQSLFRFTYAIVAVTVLHCYVHGGALVRTITNNVVFCFYPSMWR